LAICLQILFNDRCQSSEHNLAILHLHGSVNTDFLLTKIKSKKRDKLLGIDDEMWVWLARTDPHFNLICSQK